MCGWGDRRTIHENADADAMLQIQKRHFTAVSQLANSSLFFPHLVKCESVCVSLPHETPIPTQSRDLKFLSQD